ncbi:MAG: copper oxidase [Deltaproteobacteria bacterium]|nr:MAG: copper oxidase [Desulfobacterales bacterium]PIE73090.1 MAG: copper oxidase [Deltaproteobacteria bacterium]
MAGELLFLGEDFSDSLCRYAFFQRYGGASQPPYASLNVSLSVGDHAEKVLENRNRIKERLGLASLLSSRQVHGDRVYCQRGALAEDLEVDGYDALMTNVSGIGLMIQHADCQPVLLYDPVVRAVAAVHCGWRGSVINILGRVVRQMQREYDSFPENIRALVGPSLGPCCAEFRQYTTELPEAFWAEKDENSHFNFWQITSKQLLSSGLLPAHLRISGICTLCSKAYFSYRRAAGTAQGITGRNAAVICLLGGRSVNT